MEGLRRGLSRWKRYHIKVHLADEALLLPLTVRPRDTLSDLRAQLVGQGVCSWKRTFYYNARRLDDHQTVRDVRLQDGSVLLLVSDPRFPQSLLGPPALRPRSSVPATALGNRGLLGTGCNRTMSQRPAAPGTLGAPGLGAILQHGLPGGSTAPETGLHRHARCTLGATGSSFCLGPPGARLPRSPASEHPLRARLPSTRATGALGGPGDARRPPVCGPRRDLAAHSARRRRRGGGHGVAVALILLALLALLAPSGAVVRAVRAGNASTLDFAGLPALFGVPLAPEGVRGYLTETEPADACRPIEGPRPGNGSLGAIVPIRPNDCTFDLKALHAQRAGFEAAVVRNARSDELVRTAPAFEEPRRQIAIPSVFVGEAASRDLRLIVRCDRAGHVLRLPNYPPCPEPDRHPVPAASWVLGRALALLTSAVFLLRRLWRAWGPVAQTQARRKARVRTFTRRNDLCAICLDDYEEGDRLKILPCSHTYHCKCIDPWFAQAAHRSCPVCQQSLAGTEDGSDSTVQSLGDEDPSLPGHRPPLWAVQARLRSRRLRLLARGSSHGRAEATASPERPPEPP